MTARLSGLKTPSAKRPVTGDDEPRSRAHEVGHSDVVFVGDGFDSLDQLTRRTFLTGVLDKQTGTVYLAPSEGGAQLKNWKWVPGVPHARGHVALAKQMRIAPDQAAGFGLEVTPSNHRGWVTYLSRSLNGGDGNLGDPAARDEISHAMAKILVDWK